MLLAGLDGRRYVSTYYTVVYFTIQIKVISSVIDNVDKWNLPHSSGLGVVIAKVLLLIRISSSSIYHHFY